MSKSVNFAQVTWQVDEVELYKNYVINEYEKRLEKNEIDINKIFKNSNSNQQEQQPFMVQKKVLAVRKGLSENESNKID